MSLYKIGNKFHQLSYENNKIFYAFAEVLEIGIKLSPRYSHKIKVFYGLYPNMNNKQEVHFSTKSEWFLMNEMVEIDKFPWEKE